MRAGLRSAVALVLISASPVLGRAPAPSVRSLFADTSRPVLVAAHRACHTPAPHHRMMASEPENSLAGIERCIALGVDIAEVDVRRTRDGYLVLMHDDTVDRTTDGHGAVADLPLAAIRALRLRDNEGGSAAKITNQRVPTLAEALAVARGRILLNLDVQAGLYAESIAAVRKAGQADEVIVKQPAGLGSPVLADTPPFDAVPFMPILTGVSSLDTVAAQQLAGQRAPIALELPRLPAASLPPIAAIGRRAKIRLWGNSLWEGFVTDIGGDVDALRAPAAVWGRMRDAGISVIQTDEPEALMRYLATPAS